ncbi:MAG: 30S ribosomal protein S13 [Candidatus Bathyarchaeia archaeon]
MPEGFRHIVRICNTNIGGTKKLTYGLPIIAGVGENFAKAVVDVAGLDRNAILGTLSDEDVSRLEEIISFPEKYGIPTYLFNRQNDSETGDNKHLHGADLTLRTKLDIDFLKEMKCWRGLRHGLGLKVRGQKTRTTGRSGKAGGVKKKACIAAAPRRAE